MVGPQLRSVRARTVWVGLAATRILLWVALGILLVRFVAVSLTAAQFSAAQALLDAPAPGLVLIERADRPLDEASLRALGPASRVSDVLVRVNRVDGHMRVWSDDAGRVTVTALSIKARSVRAADAALRAAVEAAAGVREDASSTYGVTDAHGFVVQGSTAQDGQARRVVLMRRARFLFVIGMDARPPARSDAETLRALVLAQGWTLGLDAAWRPAGRVSGADLAGSYLTNLVFAVLLSRGLLAVDDLLADRQARWRRRFALLKRAENESTGVSMVRSRSDQPPAVVDGPVGVTVIDVTATARGRRDIARAVWLCGAFALLMLLPMADLSSFPGSLAVLAAAVPTAALAIGLQRRSRVAASLMLVVLAIASPGFALLLLGAIVGSRQEPGVAAVTLVMALIVAALVLVMAMGAVSVLWIPDVQRGARGSRTWSATTGTRRPLMGRGRRTVVLAVTLAMVLVLTALLLEGVGAAEPSWQVGLMFGSVLLFAVAFVLYRLGRRAALLTAANLMRRDRRPMVLYLRSFGDDDLRIRSHASRRHSLIERLVRRRREPFEEVMAWQLWDYGPVVAVSEPGTSSPPMGAAREELPGSTWQQRIEQWMSEARLIAVMVGRTQGLAWELERLTQLRLWHKTVLVLPPVDTAEARQRWASVRDLLGRAGLPAGLRSINPDRALALAVPPSGEAVAVVATKRNEWSYEVALEVVASQIVETATVALGAAATRSNWERHPRPAPARWARSPAPMGWFADPYQRHELRYWDGHRWTEHVFDRGTQAVDHR